MKSICNDCPFINNCDYINIHKSVCDIKERTKEIKMKYIKIVWDLVKEAGHWVSVTFKALFGNIPAVLSWIFVALILYFTLKCPIALLPKLALWACIFGLVLSVKNYGK